MSTVVLLDTNIYDCLGRDADTRERLVTLVAADRVHVVVTPKIRDELAAGPFEGIPDWFPVQRILKSVAVVDHWHVGEAMMGDGRVYTAHRGESNKVADAIIADSASTYAGVLVSNDKRLRKRFATVSACCVVLDFDEFRVWLKAFSTSGPGRHDY